MIKRIFTGDLIDLRSIQGISPIRSYIDGNEQDIEDPRDTGRRFSVTISTSCNVIVHIVRSPEALIENVADLENDWIEAVYPVMMIVPKSSPKEFDEIIKSLNDPSVPLMLDDDGLNPYQCGAKPKVILRLNYLSEHYDRAWDEIYSENKHWFKENIKLFGMDNEGKEELFILSDIYREKFVPLINERIEYLEEKILNLCEN